MTGDDDLGSMTFRSASIRASINEARLTEDGAMKCDERLEMKSWTVEVMIVFPTPGGAMTMI